MAADFAALIIGPVIESLLVPVKRHLGYLFLSTQHLRKLNDGMKQLEATSVDVKTHKDTNERETREIPARVPGWLEQVEKIKTDAIVRNGNGGCFNIKARYQTGRKAWKTTQEIEQLLLEGRAFIWTDAQKPLGRVYTTKASTSAPSPSSSSSSSGGDSIGEAFKSRATTFDDALKLLQQDQKTTQVIALCGMGGVGKTTMMLQLKKVAQEKKMFDWIVKLDIGRQPNWHSLQQAVAENLGKPFKEEAETTWADHLRTRFEEALRQREKGILVILDDVWEKVELKDIGLSPLPNRVKLFLTSRSENICRTIAVHEGNLDLKVLRVEVLDQTEALKFFCQITKITEESDRELYQIGGEIVKKCSCLPLAIKLIGPTLISEEKSIWKDRLTRLRNNDLDHDVHEVIRISYDYLKDQEDKEIFLLCGLFPEDSNIPIEDLTRYAWGLKLLKRVSAVEDGRNRIKRCVSNLKKANLLIDGDFSGCVKMHDLVLAFVLATVETGDHASFINHKGSSKWSDEGVSESCKRLSLTCTGLSEFPEGFNCPNVSLLKLMRGHDSFKFPQGFYENTENLQVIAYEKMQYPLLPRSLQSCSTNLRTLCLHKCSLMFDISSIGDLSNLEVLTITECKIRKLPSAIGKLEKLKVLDLTGCLGLLIDDGVLERLVNLEELYMLGTSSGIEAVRFTDANVDELVRCSKNLTSLAIVFNDLPKNISFEKLERFKISLGCDLDQDNGESRYKFENTLKLVIDKCEILYSMNKLFDKVEALHLELNGANDHRDALAESLQHHRSSFYNLRVLSICNCENLRYLFTVPVANGLGKLERLEISSCSVLETVIDGNIEGGVGEIKFQALKFLSLEELPNLKSLYNVANEIQLPELKELRLSGLPKFTSIYSSVTCSMSSNISEAQSLLNEEAVVPNLEVLYIDDMENLKEIWPCQFGSSQEVNVCKLRELDVYGCNSLVTLFPRNPMSLLHHLEGLSVNNCGSIEVLFNIDLECAGTIDEARCCLRSIRASGSKNLRHVWSIKGANDFDCVVISSFQAIERIEIESCERFRNVFTPTATNFEMRQLTNLKIDCGEDYWQKIRQEQEIDVMSDEEISRVDDTTLDVVFSSNLIRTFNHVRELCISNHERAEVVFEIETPCVENTKQSLLFPDLIRLELHHMERMSHVWKCSWNKRQSQGSSSSSFHNLTTIYLFRCDNIKYLFSPLMAKLLSNLKKINIDCCDVIEEVVSNRDAEDEELVASTSTNTSIRLFPYLELLDLHGLPNLKHIGGGNGAKGKRKEISSTTPIHDQSKLSQVNDVAWSLCQYSREIAIHDCEALPYVIPSYALGQMQKLEILTIGSCKSMVEVFETQGFNIKGYDTTNFDEGSVGNDATMVAQRMTKVNASPLFNLKVLVIEKCDLLHHVLTFSTLEILTQLEELRISDCKAMEVIVNVDNGEQTMKSSKVNLKKLVIKRCDLLHHVFTFSTLESLTQLEELRISNCKAMEVIVKVDNGEQTMKSSKVMVLPHLKSIALYDLPNLTGFFLGKNIQFEWRLLDDVTIEGCPQMMMFTSGWSITPKLNYIHTELGKHSTLECGLNFRMLAESLHESPVSSLDTSRATISDNTPWSFDNIIKMAVVVIHGVKKIIPSNMLVRLQKLEKLSVNQCDDVEEVFEAPERPDDDELQSVVVKLPSLREVKLKYLDNLKYIWKNNPWMVLEFPNLTKLLILECPSMQHVFTSSMVGSLPQLQELYVGDCNCMEVIVKEAKVVVEEEEGEGECDDKVKEIIMLPHLKSLKLARLPILKGFYLGKEAFSWSSLDTLEIIDCRAMSVFTKGDLTTSKLRVIDTSVGRWELGREEDLNSFINTKYQQGCFDIDDNI